METTITLDNLKSVLEMIGHDGCTIIRTDFGNGCAGPMLCNPEDLLEDLEQFDRVESIMDISAENLTRIMDALHSFGWSFSDIAGFTHVAFASSQTGETNEWKGLYLLWIPYGECLTEEQVDELRKKLNKRLTSEV